MSNDIPTGKMRTMVETPIHKAADMAKGNPLVTLAVIVTMLTGQGAGIVWGVKRIGETEKKADTAIQTAIAVQATVTNIDKNLSLIVQMAGGKPAKVDSATGDTYPVVIHYNDTTGRGVYTHGDTAFVPMPDTLKAISPTGEDST